MRSPALRCVLATILTAVAGCAAPKPAATDAGATPPAAGESSTTPAPLGQATAAAEPAGPRDPVKSGIQYFQIELYQLAVPVGSISGNATFWKPFDETFLGLWQHDVLAKNGFRVGKAPSVELKYLTDQFADAEQTLQSMVGQKGSDVEIPVRKEIARQTLFYFDRNGNTVGRDFERVDDLFAISFRQTPRKPDHVTLTIAPIVRAQQSKLEVMNPLTLEVRRVQPQSLYELGIKLDLALDECLVIAPDESATTNEMLVGRAFMLEERPSQLVEKALVIIPRIRGTMVEVTPPAAAPARQ